jgi:hypothetical protein
MNMKKMRIRSKKGRENTPWQFALISNIITLYCAWGSVVVKALHY